MQKYKKRAFNKYIFISIIYISISFFYNFSIPFKTNKVMKHLFYFILVVAFLSSCKTKTDQTLVKPSESANFNAEIGNITDFKTITFPSKDGLKITADLYLVAKPKEFILLCHQAGYSRGEYIETAKKLNKLGYSCMAMDQRSGDVVNNVINETAKRAKEKGLKPIVYLDTKQDMEAAITYVYKMNASKPIIIVGSSYSASLALLLATNNPKIKAVAAFSPGECLKGLNLTNAIAALNKPVFVTSSKKEISQVAGIFSKVKSKNKVHFKPTVVGIHGSRVLWKKTKGHASFWKAFTDFLKM